MPTLASPPPPAAPPAPGGGAGEAAFVFLSLGLVVGLLLGFLAGYGSRRPAPPVRCVSTLRAIGGDGVWEMRCER